MKSISRREFLKLSGLLSLNLAAPQHLTGKNLVLSDPKPQNVLIVVFDALSAWNMSRYGYARQTTPNIDRLSEKSIVYHRHFASSNFTTPGTASLLTGTNPWTHRALNHRDTVLDKYVKKNIFTAFPKYHRSAYSHNGLAEILLLQFANDIELLTPRSNLFLGNDRLVDLIFRSDEDIAGVGWYRSIKNHIEGNSYSLFLAHLYRIYKERRVKSLGGAFPRGFPSVSGDNYFILEDGINWLKSHISDAPQPFLGYYHFLPPHSPYKTRQDFYGAFDHDNYRPVDKPYSIFGKERKDGAIDKLRLWYDEFILYVDAEFSRLYKFMMDSGLLENTWLVLTSDHGEIFDRGIVGHQTPAFYQPLLHIPLLIFAPGQTARIDITENTSAIDVLPTLAYLNGQPFPDWVEGKVLPPFRETGSTTNKDIFALRSKNVNKSGPILQGSAMLTRGPNKLTYIFGHQEPAGAENLVTLYNLEDDPEELVDLSHAQKDLAEQLLNELVHQMEQSI